MLTRSLPKLVANPPSPGPASACPANEKMHASNHWSSALGQQPTSKAVAVNRHPPSTERFSPQAATPIQKVHRGPLSNQGARSSPQQRRDNRTHTMYQPQPSGGFVPSVINDCLKPPSLMSLNDCRLPHDQQSLAARGYTNSVRSPEQAYHSPFQSILLFPSQQPQRTPHRQPTPHRQSTPHRQPTPQGSRNNRNERRVAFGGSFGINVKPSSSATAIVVSRVIAGGQADIMGVEVGDVITGDFAKFQFSL